MKTLKFNIYGSLPNLNDIIAKAKQHPKAYSSMKNKIDDYVCQCIQLQNPGRLPCFDKIHLSCTWFEDTKRRDPDNIVVAKKFILDALVQMAIIPNDGWRHVASFHDVWFKDKETRIWVVVTETNKNS